MCPRASKCVRACRWRVIGWWRHLKKYPPPLVLVLPNISCSRIFRALEYCVHLAIVVSCDCRRDDDDDEERWFSLLWIGLIKLSNFGGQMRLASCDASASRVFLMTRDYGHNGDNDDEYSRPSCRRNTIGVGLSHPWRSAPLEIRTRGDPHPWRLYGGFVVFVFSSSWLVTIIPGQVISRRRLPQQSPHGPFTSGPRWIIIIN